VGSVQRVEKRALCFFVAANILTIQRLRSHCLFRQNHQSRTLPPYGSNNESLAASPPVAPGIPPNATGAIKCPAVLGKKTRREIGAENSKATIRRAWVPPTAQNHMAGVCEDLARRVLLASTRFNVGGAGNGGTAKKLHAAFSIERAAARVLWAAGVGGFFPQMPADIFFLGVVDEFRA